MPRSKDENDDSETEAKEEPTEEETSPPEEGEEDAGAGDDANLLTDFQYRFDWSLRMPSRNLCVKDLMLLWDPSTVYGRRAAFHKALLVTDTCFQTIIWVKFEFKPNPKKVVTKFTEFYQEMESSNNNKSEKTLFLEASQTVLHRIVKL